MKRYLLFVMLCVCVSIGAWAAIPSGATAIGSNGSYWIVNDGVVTVHVEKAGDLIGWAQNELSWSGANVPWKNNNPQPKTLKFEPASSVSMTEMGNYNDFYILWENPPYTYDIIDFSGLTDTQATEIINADNLKFGDNATKGILVPSKYCDDPDAFISKTGVNNYGINGTEVTANVKNNSTFDLAGVAAKASGAVTSIGISGGSALDLDLSGYTALQNVDLSSASVNNVNLTNLSNLKTVNLEGATISGQVDVTGSLHDGLKITVLSSDVDKIIPTLTDEQKAEYLNIEEIVPAPAGAWQDANGCCWISYDSTTKVATVHAKKPGHFATLFNAHKNDFADGTTFVFDSSSKPNAADLAILAGEKDQWGTNTNRNTFYVDLYDIPTGEGTTIEAAITEAINMMRENNWQYKGLLLPKNPTTVGTTLIQDSEQNATSIATCSQFIAYQNASTMAAHIYKAADDYSAAGYADRFTAFKSVISRHSDIASSATDYLISTNSTTSFDVTSLPSTATKVLTINNEMVRVASGLASVYAYPAAGGAFYTVVDNTSIRNTPSELLQLNGAVLEEDITAISNFVSGPRVLDLRNATGLTADMVSKITNSNIEYILLPEGWSKADVNTAANTTNMSGLKTVISTNTTTLVAYVNEAGSLAEARTLATGGAYGGYPAIVGLTSVTLSGNLNASDLANQVNQSSKIGSDGHLYSDATFNVTGMPNVVASDTGNGYQPVSSAPGQGTSALNGEGSISTLDLSSAVFANQYDMNFNLLGLVNNNLQTLKLPTSQDMTILPTGALMGSSGNVIDYLCIPSNFTTIKRYALGNTTVRCLTTDNANHTVIVGANGEQYATDAEAKAACYDTFTLSSNIASVGMGAFLPQSETITDVYVMATTTPECERDAFSSGMLYGWGGFDGAGAYCREKYKNGGKLFTMLHFPEQGSMTDAAYEQMKKNYTDVNKEYTKKDQTGAVDGNGDPIAWPSQNEIYRAYNQASLGLTWNDWPVKKNPEVNTTGNGDDYSATLVPNVTADVSNGTPTGVGDYPFTNYIGWHQFVLSMATYFDQPDIIIENEKTVLQFVEGDWYTLCLPFSLTEAQLIEMLGVPKTEGNTISRIVNQDGTVKEDNVTETKLPDLRTLRTVTRTPNDPTVGNKNHVRFLLTQDLTQVVQGDFNYWGINVSEPSQSGYSQNGSVTGTGEKIALRGGYPYLVKPYIRYGENVTNLGKYILTRFASEFETDKLSCKRRDDCFEYLNGETETSKFAKPYEKHKIQAMLDVEGSEGGYTTHKDGKKYNYAFVGQFWEQDLPRYAFYMVNNKWYRYTSGNKGWRWEPYKCIIMATQQTENNVTERAHASSGLYRDDANSVYPISQGTDAKGAEIFNELLEIRFLNGRDDAIFDSSNESYAKFSFVFDDNIIDVTEDETTGIMKLDGEDIQTVPANGKVYTASGQFVGTSLDGLSKGLYIVNGKKYVVK